MVFAISTYAHFTSDAEPGALVREDDGNGFATAHKQA
jgi:hypothetical protein